MVQTLNQVKVFRDLPSSSEARAKIPCYFNEKITLNKAITASLSYPAHLSIQNLLTG